jgi:membrane associated rhomboid family serine protease
MSLTDLITGITVLLSIVAFQNEKLLSQCMMNPYQVVRKGQYYRFISSGFIHAGWVHLIFNMISFYSFGQAIELLFRRMHGPVMGPVYYLLLYLGAIVVSEIPTYLRYRNFPQYNSLGASGGVSAIIFAWILYYPLNTINIYFALPVPGFVLGVVYLVFSYQLDKQGGGNINHSAHLYGALFGFVFALVLDPTALLGFFEQISQWNLFG